MCKQNAFEIHLDVPEIYFRCNLTLQGLELGGCVFHNFRGFCQ